MVSNPNWWFLMHRIALVGCGLVGAYAWSERLIGLLLSCSLVMIWLLATSCRQTPMRSSLISNTDSFTVETQQLAIQRLIIDMIPMPLVLIDGGAVRVLNRAARSLFASDDRIISPPAALSDFSVPSLRHEGRIWRIERVESYGNAHRNIIAVLIDLEREEFAAEARANANMIEILDHELLNGLSPIVSLAESAQAVASSSPIDQVLLQSILDPLARKAEGLRRFTRNYRSLARLPAPTCRPIAVNEIVHDIARSFVESWPDIELNIVVPEQLIWSMDQDQINQALWSLLVNAAAAVTGRVDAKVWFSAVQERTRLVFTIVDNGAGIASEHAALIFRPFFTTKREGSGIGLTLARQIAVAHGGALCLQGLSPTKFQLSLPG